MIKAVIFDLNGVFFKSELLSVRFKQKYGISEDVFLPALNKIMEKVRLPGAPRAFSFWEPYFDKWGLNLSEKDFFVFWFSGEKLIPSLVSIVDELKDKGLKVFILSNNFKERTEHYRRQFPDFFKRFDGSNFSWETGFVKPDKGAYFNLLEENSLRPEECIYFDDSDKNIEAARSLGINAEKYEDLKGTRMKIEKFLTVSKKVEKK